MGLAEAVLDGSLRLRLRDGGGHARRFCPTELDVELLSVVEAAVVDGVPLGIVFPLPGTAVPVLVGAAALVSTIRRTASLNVSAALVASNLASRLLYDRLYFRDQRLADFVPRATIGPDGQPKLIGTALHDSGGRFHVVSRLDRLDTIAETLAVRVVDASAVAPAEVGNLLASTVDRRALVYVTSNPFDPVLGDIRGANGVIWGWSADRVARLAAPAVTPSSTSAGALAADPLLLSAAADCAVEIRLLGNGQRTELDTALSRAWRALRSLSLAYRGGGGLSASSREGMWWAWGVFGAMAMLPVDPERYDRHVGHNPYMLRLRDTPAIARGFARHTTGEVDHRWHEVADAFSVMLSAAREGTRLAGIVEWIADRVQSGAPGLLLTRNRGAALAVVSALDDSPLTAPSWDEMVHVATLADLDAGRASAGQPRSILLPGPLPRSRSGLFAMPPGSDLRVLAAGPFEAERLHAQALSARQAMIDLGVESIEHSAPRLDVSVREAANLHSAARAVRVLTTSGLAVAPPPQTDNPWEPFDLDLVRSLRRVVGSTKRSADDDDFASTSMRSDLRAGDGTVDVMSVEVDDLTGAAQVILLEPNDVVSRRRDEVIERVAAKSLHAGDTLLLVDRGARRDLLGTAIDRLAETPTYAGLHFLIDFWKVRASLAVNCGLTYGEIQRKMRGTRLTSEQAIGTWIRGLVDGPRDPEDVTRFALAVGDPELLREAERVGWALNTIHSVHRQVGRWLSRMIAAARPQDEDLMIDAGMSIHVADLLDTVTAHRVRAVDAALRPVPARDVGILRDLTSVPAQRPEPGTISSSPTS
ncbi:MAG: hypothetical protein ACRDUW_02050 [Pseudonocardiaceae bacterium]